MTDQYIYELMAKLLWKIMPDKYSVIIFNGSIFSNSSSFQIELHNDEGIDCFDLDDPRDDVGYEIIDLAYKLLTVEPFYNQEPWSHFQISLTQHGQFNISFAYILEEDIWPGLYMRGISDLKREELDQFHIPESDWKQMVQFKSKLKPKA